MLNSEYFKLETDDFVYFNKNIIDTYPNWQKVIPQNFKYSFDLSNVKNDLLEVLNKDKKAKLCELKFSDNSLSVYLYQNIDENREAQGLIATKHLDIDNSCNRRATSPCLNGEMYVNPKYLIQALQGCENPIIQINEVNMPFSVKCGNENNIIMPLKK